MRWTSVFLLPLLAGATPALACRVPAPVPGQHQPTQAERLRGEWNRFDTIVQVEVQRTGSVRDRVPVKVLHTYKGRLRTGVVLSMGRGLGFDPPLCAAMLVPIRFRFTQGERTVIAFRAAQPEFNRVEQDDFDFMVRQGWVLPIVRTGR